MCSVFCILCGCSISYKFNGANINYQTTHSISIADFPNNAAMVNPLLSPSLTEAIRDLYQRQTRLQVLSKGGDLEIEGEIVGYDVSQGATPKSPSTRHTALRRLMTPASCCRTCRISYAISLSPRSRRIYTMIR